MFPDEAYLLCAECIRRHKEGECLYLVFTSEFEPPGPPEEGFRQLFKAARVLMRERVNDEDQIIPTLVFAHEIDRGAAGGTPATSYGIEPPLLPKVHEVVKIVDEVRILEEEPIRADILVGRRSHDAEDRVIPQGALIQVSFHKKRVEPERVASVYEEVLAAREIAFGGVHSGTMEYEFVGNRLYLTVKLKKEAPDDGSIFPPPRLLEAFYDGLFEVFGKRLTMRGRVFEAHNLIPASVAFFLRASGGIASRKGVHRLLNDHLFCEKRLPEDGYANTSEVVKLWNDVPKAGDRIARMLPFVWGRLFPNPSRAIN